MFKIRYAEECDETFWFSLDRHLSKSEYILKVRDKRGYVIYDDEKPIGVMRYNLFWDNTPFLTLIHFEETYRSKGFGKQAMLFWEDEMRNFGYKMVMTSTQADETSQHFYRKLGYKDKGSIVFDIPPFEQPLEMILAKSL